MRVPKRRSENYIRTPLDPYLTPQAIKEMEDDLIRMKKKVQPKLIEEMQSAAAHGDFSENAAYQIAKGKLRGLNNRMLEVQEKLKRAIPIEAGSETGKISIGSIVTVEVNGRKKIYQILGAQETNPNEGIISHLSPLGLLLIGHQAGDTVIFDTGEKKVEYKIITVK